MAKKGSLPEQAVTGKVFLSVQDVDGHDIPGGPERPNLFFCNVRMTGKKNISLMALSLLSFSLADVRDGLGPFLGVYLQGKNWTPDEIG